MVSPRLLLLLGGGRTTDTRTEFLRRVISVRRAGFVSDSVSSVVCVRVFRRLCPCFPLVLSDVFRGSVRFRVPPAKRFRDGQFFHAGTLAKIRGRRKERKENTCEARAEQKWKKRRER